MQGYRAVHRPVLADEVVEYLRPDAGRSLLIDSTLGEGGHAEVFLKAFPLLLVTGVEADPEIAALASSRLEGYGERFRMYRMNFAEFYNRYTELMDEEPDRILFDLGISMYHYRNSGRGFSFEKNEKLDMRLNPDSPLKASDIVNTWPEKELADLLFEYGGERYSRRIARRIVSRRDIGTSVELAGIISSAVPPAYRHRRIHPATRTFQALRMKVNNELENLETALKLSFGVLKSGGRLGVVSFHSLEDGMVKNFFREKNKECVCPPDLPICQCGGKKELNILTKKPVRAGKSEWEGNPASRSARLRVAEKL